MAYANLNFEPELIKIKTRDDDNKNLNYRTQKFDHEKIVKSLRIDND